MSPENSAHFDTSLYQPREIAAPLPQEAIMTSSAGSHDPQNARAAPTDLAELFGSLGLGKYTDLFQQQEVKGFS